MTAAGCPSAPCDVVNNYFSYQLNIEFPKQNDWIQDGVSSTGGTSCFAQTFLYGSSIPATKQTISCSQAFGTNTYFSWTVSASGGYLQSISFSLDGGVIFTATSLAVVGCSNCVSMKNSYFQSVYVGYVSPTYTYANFTSGYGSMDYGGVAPTTCNQKVCWYTVTGETSNMLYDQPWAGGGSGNWGQYFYVTWAMAGLKQGHNTAGSTTFSLLYPTLPLQGDLLVAMVGTYTTGVTFKVTDTQVNAWTSAVSDCVNDCVQIFYATAKSTSVDTVKFTASSDPSSDFIYGFIVDFTGSAVTLDKVSSGHGTGTQPHVQSFTPSKGTVVVDITAAAGTANYSPGTYYTMIGSNPGWWGAAAYEVYWSHGSTIAPWSSNNNAYDEVAASFS
jgi:hypothetical protein